jgi:hypothetical protein
VLNSLGRKQSRSIVVSIVRVSRRDGSTRGRGEVTVAVYNRVYDTYRQAEQAVLELEGLGVPTSDISLVAKQPETKLPENARKENAGKTATGAGAALGAALGGSAGLLAGLGVIVIPGIGSVSSAGWLASAALGAVAGSVTGGLIGALVDAGASEQDANVFSEAVRRGGTLVTINTDLLPGKIAAILDTYQPINATQRREEYENGGWTRFEPGTPSPV